MLALYQLGNTHYLVNRQFQFESGRGTWLTRWSVAIQ